MTSKPWSIAFRRSKLVTALFVISSEYLGPAREWVDAQGFSSGHSTHLYSASKGSWAFADGGATSYYGYGFGGLPNGLRVIGWDALRLLVGEMGLAQPRVLAGEAEYRAAREAGLTPGPWSGKETAEILVTYDDGPTLQRVVRNLLGDAGLGEQRGPTAPAPGEWGDAGFDVQVGEILSRTGSVTPSQAAALVAQHKITWELGYEGVEIAHRILELAADSGCHFLARLGRFGCIPARTMGGQPQRLPRPEALAMGSAWPPASACSQSRALRRYVISASTGARRPRLVKVTAGGSIGTGLCRRAVPVAIPRGRSSPSEHNAAGKPSTTAWALIATAIRE